MYICRILSRGMLLSSSPFACALQHSSQNMDNAGHGELHHVIWSSFCCVLHLRGLLEQMIIKPFELMQFFKFHPKGPEAGGGALGNLWLILAEDPEARTDLEKSPTAQRLVEAGVSASRTPEGTECFCKLA